MRAVAFELDKNQRPLASPQVLSLRRHCDHVQLEDVAVGSGAERQSDRHDRI